MTPYEQAELAMNAALAALQLAMQLAQNARQDSELTPEQETELDAKQSEIMTTGSQWIVRPDPS